MGNDDDLLDVTTAVKEQQNGIVEVTLRARTHFGHLALDKDSDLILFFVVINAHALVLVQIGCSVGIGVFSAGGDDPRNVTVILHSCHNRLVLDV